MSLTLCTAIAFTLIGIDIKGTRHGCVIALALSCPRGSCTRTCNLLAEYYCCKRIFPQIFFSPALDVDGAVDVKLAAFTVNGKVFTFGRSAKKGDESLSGASIQVTGAGGNGFSVRCDLLYPQEMYKVRDKVVVLV